MKSLLTVFSFFVCFSTLSQNNLSTDNAKIIIDIFFQGYKSGDTVKMKSVMHPHMTMQTAYLNKNQENIVNYVKASDFLKFASTTATQQKWDEQLKDYIVNSDGNLAHVWTPYEFFINDKFSHCGANSFTLVYTDDSWKIFNIIDSRRIGSCNPEEKTD